MTEVPERDRPEPARSPGGDTTSDGTRPDDGAGMVIARGIRGLTRLAIRRLDRHLPRRMGTKGRDFTGAGGGEEKQAGPNATQVEEFNGEPALEPIRVYVGLGNACSLDERVDLAIRELERTNAFDREVLAVYGTTGTGWIDERVADSLEYIWGGDTEAVGLQYSYLPSWVSFLVDRQKASDSGTALIDAVVERVEQLPENDRPKVVLFGESLGSLATESAFESLDEMVESTDGAMLVGPTFANDLRQQFTDDRDEGSPSWRPVYQEGARCASLSNPTISVGRTARGTIHTSCTCRTAPTPSRSSASICCGSRRNGWTTLGRRMPTCRCRGSPSSRSGRSSPT